MLDMFPDSYMVMVGDVTKEIDSTVSYPENLFVAVYFQPGFFGAFMDGGHGRLQFFRRPGLYNHIVTITAEIRECAVIFYDMVKIVTQDQVA